MISFNYIFRNWRRGYKVTQSQEKFNQHMYIDDIKVCAKNEKELETLIQTIRTYCQDIGMEFGIKNMSCQQRKVGKENQRKKQNYEVKKTSESWERRTLQVLWNIVS